jgi:hypothetical protein
MLGTLFIYGLFELEPVRLAGVLLLV